MRNPSLLTVMHLLTQIPRPPEDEGVVPPGATEQQLQALADRLGRGLPAELREWLSLCNGVMAGPGGIYGADQSRPSLDIATHLDLHPGWLERGWIPLAGDGHGNCYALDASRTLADVDIVLFIDVMEREDEPAYAVASSLGQFLVFLLRREVGERRWPFDEVFVTTVDPDIRLAPTDLLPWNT